MAAESSDVHRNITQLLLDEGIFPEATLIDHLGECADRHDKEAKRAKIKMHQDGRDAETLKKVVEKINGQLQPLGLMIARMKSKITGQYEVYYGLVNVQDDSFAKQEWLKKPEQEFFHKLVEAITDSDDKQVEAVAAAKYAPAPPARERASHTSLRLTARPCLLSSLSLHQTTWAAS